MASPVTRRGEVSKTGDSRAHPEADRCCELTAQDSGSRPSIRGDRISSFPRSLYDIQLFLLKGSIYYIC
jgi:hypothetical protein